MINYPVSGKVEIFKVQNPWVFVRSLKKYTYMFKGFSDRGLVPITITLGKCVWKSSLLPMGDGTHFIALPFKVRKAEGIRVGARVKLFFTLRER